MNGPLPFGIHLSRAPRPRMEAEGVRCACGHWPGRHRWGDYACPNPRWRCGNGQPQWLEQSYRLPEGST